MTPALLAQVVSLTHQALALGGVGAVAIPIAIHLLARLRRRPQPWGAMRFLLDVQRRHRHRLRLEQWLLLAVRCLIPLVLGLALAGPVLGGYARGLFGWAGSTGGGQQRLVCLVIHDTLSTHADDVEDQSRDVGRSRFDRLRDVAMSVIDGLGPGDRLGVWRSARPGGVVQAIGLFDPAAARRAIESIKPRYSRGDMSATLSLVDTALDQHSHPPDRTFVVLVSDFANGALPVDRPVPAEVERLSTKAMLLVTRPAATAANIQVAGLHTESSRVLPGADDAPPTLRVQVELRRFVTDPARTHTPIEVAVFGSDSSQPWSVASVDHHWSPGQTQVVIPAVMRLNPRAMTGTGGVVGDEWAGDQVISVRARIGTGQTTTGVDALGADNERWAVATLRSRLYVGVIDSPGATGSTAGWSELSPGQWCRLALVPAGANGSSTDTGAMTRAGYLELVTLDAGAIDAVALNPLDAVMVFRPDLMDQRGWQALRGLAARGGLVWVFAPRESEPALWGGALRDPLGLDWQISMEPQLVGDDDSQGVRLDTDTPVPEPLNVLGADWRSLLAPIAVTKRYALSLPETGEFAGDVWLRAADGSPLLVSGPVGDGRVMLMTSAVDLAWTNLPTKPLFVPLLHETLRGVLSTSNGGGEDLVCGDQPVLGGDWDAATQLERATVDVSEQGASGEAPTVYLRRTESGHQPSGTLDWPGVYHARPLSVGSALAVNPDERAGDTRAIDTGQLGRWLSQAGDRWSWLDDADPAGSLMVTQAQASVAWPLLWVMLGLVIVEMLLARYASHAVVQTGGMGRRLMAVIRGGIGKPPGTTTSGVGR